MKGEIDALLAAMNVRPAEYYAVKENPSYHPGRCAGVRVGGVEVGVFGQVHPLVAKNYGIDSEIYAAELDFTALSALLCPPKTFRPLPKYPTVNRDIAVVAARVKAVLEKLEADLGARLR